MAFFLPVNPCPIFAEGYQRKNRKEYRQFFLNLRMSYQRMLFGDQANQSSEPILSAEKGWLEILR